MDSSTIADKEDHDTVMTSPPPTQVITVKNEYTVKDHDHMLILAQKKFDRMRQRNREKARSTRFNRLASRSISGRLTSSRAGMTTHDRQRKDKVDQILSSLLYLSLMMHKVDKMKKILEHHDSNLYNEWNMLIGSLHSPVFHMRERKVQNDRVKKIYNRKKRYKIQYEEMKLDLMKSQDTLKQMSLSLNKLTEDNNRNSLLLHEKQNVESDLAAVTKESEMRKNNIDTLENQLNSFKSECSDLHSKIESLQMKHGEQIQNIETLEKYQDKKEKLIESLQADLKSSNGQNQELEYRILELDKESKMIQKELTKEKLNYDRIKQIYDEKLIHKEQKLDELQILLKKGENKLTELENTKNESISNLNELVAISTKDLKVQKSALTMTQNELRQTRKDLDTKTSDLSKTLDMLQNERYNSLLLQEKLSTAMNEIGNLSQSIEKQKSDSLTMAQTITSLENQLEKSVCEAENKVTSLDKDLKLKEGKIIQTEKDISDLICTNQSLERSLSEALLSKTTVEEQKQRLLDGEIKSVNLSIEELAAENLRVTKMMESMKDSLMQDVHNALKRQKEAEEKAETLEKDLMKAEKEVAVLRCENVSLEKSLTNLQSCAEEQKQKLIDDETNSVNSSIAKLTAENLRINNMMGSMKDSLMKDVHDALEQQNIAQQKVDLLQSELVKSEKEVAVLRSKNISLEQSLAEALRTKSNMEEQNKKINERDTASVNLSIEKLTLENRRLSEMMDNMKEDVLGALSHQIETRQTVTDNVSLGSNSDNAPKKDKLVVNSKSSDRDSYAGLDGDISAKDDLIKIQADKVVVEVFDSAANSISSMK